MRNLLMSAASAIALLCAAGPLAAQTEPTPSAAAAATLTSAQKMDYETWAPDQRASFDAWPLDYQAYYWTLSPNQMHGWWKLTAAQRTQIMVMTPDQRTSSWTSIEAQLAGQAASAVPPVSANPVGSADMPSDTAPNPETAATPVPPAMPADSSYQATPYKGALTAPPAEAMNKVYPLCTKTVRDSCRNRGGK